MRFTSARRAFTRRHQGVTGVAAALLGCTMIAGSAGSANAAEPQLNCLMGTSTCSYSSHELAAAGLEPVLALYLDVSRVGDPIVIWGEERPNGRVCSKRTDTYDFTIILSGGLRREVESIEDYAGAHCDWRLIDKDGVASVRVEGSMRDLRNLGDGWRNRAVRIQLT